MADELVHLDFGRPPARERALRALYRIEARNWAYESGEPRYVADAFAEYVDERYGDVDERFRPSLSEAKTAFNYDQRGIELRREHGSKPLD